MTDRKLNKHCRWEDLVEDVVGPVKEVLLYAGEPDHQGSASIAILREDGLVVAYAWSWGSCSVCDAWEDAPDGQARGEIQSNMKAMSPDVAVDFLLGLKRGGGDFDGEALDRAIGRCMELAGADLAKTRATDLAWIAIAKAAKP